jgi:prolyl 4-hydroxylase
MALDQIGKCIVTDSISTYFGFGAIWAQDTSVCMANGPVALGDLDEKEIPVAQDDLRPDTKVFPDGLEYLDLVASNETLPCPDISEMPSYILHESPHILYIPNFVSPEEISHLIDATYDLKSIGIDSC